MTAEPEAAPKRMGCRRKIAIAGLVFLAFMIYRVFGVYTIRSGECDLSRPLVAAERLQTRNIEGGRLVRFPARPAGIPREQRLIVMSYNAEGHAALLKGKKHLEGLAEVIRRHKPDIVGLQEVHRNTWQSRRTDQAAELARLTGMNVVFGRSFDAAGGEFGNAILTRGEILASQVHELPSIGEPRTALEAHVRIDGAELSFFVTHLTTWGRFRRASRQEQIACVTEAVRRSERPYILVGDFNAAPDAPEIVAMLGSEHLRACGDTSQGTHKLTRQHLDYIFSDHGWETRAARVIAEGPSDHYPLLAELRWHIAAGEELESQQ